MSAAKPPTTLTVGPYTYAVSLSDGLDDGLLRGCTDTDAHTIRLNRRNPPALQRSTLLHEALHAVANVAGIRDERLTQEQFVTRLEAPLTALLRDNPTLVTFITA